MSCRVYLAEQESRSPSAHNFSGPGGKILPGAHLKQVRERLGLSVRQVEQLSKRLAEAKSSKEYSISHAWLTRLEKGLSTPGIYALFSLSVIYRLSFVELLALYGIHPEAAEGYAQLIKLPGTHLVASEFGKDNFTDLPTLSLRESALGETGLLSSKLEQSGEMPVAMLKRLGIQLSRYGYIGLNDFMMYPILRPGSIVLIDEQQNKLVTGEWRSDYDRPIYFLEMRDRYACAWCRLDGNQLTLLPHPMSPCSDEHFLYPRDVEIIGRVVGVYTPLPDPAGASSPQTLTSPETEPPGRRKEDA